MTDHAAPTRTQASGRRPALSQTILSVAATATAVAALIWSALFYDATRNHAAALPATPTQPTGGRRRPPLSRVRSHATPPTPTGLPTT